MEFVIAETFRIILCGILPSAEVPVMETLICEFHLTLLTDGVPELIAGLGLVRKIHAGSDGCDGTVSAINIIGPVTCFCLVQKHLGIAEDCEIALALVQEEASLVSGPLDGLVTCEGCREVIDCQLGLVVKLEAGDAPRAGERDGGGGGSWTTYASRAATPLRR